MLATLAKKDVVEDEWAIRADAAALEAMSRGMNYPKAFVGDERMKKSIRQGTIGWQVNTYLVIAYTTVVDSEIIILAACSISAVLEHNCDL